MNWKLRYFLSLLPVISLVVTAFLIIFSLLGYIGHTPVVGEKYIIHSSVEQNPFEPPRETSTNTVLAVKNGYVLYVNQFDFTNSSKVSMFRFLNKRIE